MFNINNLLTAKVNTLPWKHQLVTGFFDPESLATIAEGVSKLVATLSPDTTYNSDTKITLYQAKEHIGQQAFDIILAANEVILDNVRDILALYPDHRVYDSVMCVPSFSFIAANDASSMIHDSAIEKVCSIVAFMTPDVAVRTSLYPTNNPADGSISVMNQYNTALVHCPVTDVTFFKYNPISDAYVTLTFFVRKNAFNTLIVDANGNYQYTLHDGSKVTIPKDASSDATVADSQSGKLIRNLV